MSKPEKIRLKCPQCKKTILAPIKAAGRSGKCPGCGFKVSIPQLASVTQNAGEAHIASPPSQVEQQVPTMPSQEVEAKRLAEEAKSLRVAEKAEVQRIAEEAEALRAAEEAEARRKAEEEAEAQRIAEEAEALQAAEEAEARHKAKEEAEAERVVEPEPSQLVAAETSPVETSAIAPSVETEPISELEAIESETTDHEALAFNDSPVPQTSAISSESQEDELERKWPKWMPLAAALCLVALIYGTIIMFSEPDVASKTQTPVSEEQKTVKKQPASDQRLPDTSTPKVETFEEKQKMNLRRVLIAVHVFESKFGKLPFDHQACDRHEELSWRAAILPFISQENLADQIDLQAGSNGPSNQKLADQMPSEFGPDGKNSTVLRVSSKSLPNRSSEIPDGVKNTIAMISHPTRTQPWLENRDITPDEVVELFANLKENETIAVGFYNTNVREISAGISEETLRNLLDPNDGNPVDFSQIK